MDIPWKVIAAEGLTVAEIRAYAGLSRLRRASTEQVALAAAITASQASKSLQRLTNLGVVRRQGFGWQQVIKVTRAHAPNGVPLDTDLIRSASSLRSEDPPFASLREGPEARATPYRQWATRDGAARAFAEENVSKKWTPLGLLGLFYSLYAERYKTTYKVSTAAENLREIELYVEAIGQDMAEWGLRAYFSDHMKWLEASRTLTFLTPERVQKWLLGAAAKLKGEGEKSPEWKGARVTAKTGVWSRPKEM